MGLQRPHLPIHMRTVVLRGRPQFTVAGPLRIFTAFPFNSVQMIAFEREHLSA